MRNQARITKNNSQGIIFAIISCQRVIFLSFSLKGETALKRANAAQKKAEKPALKKMKHVENPGKSGTKQPQTGTKSGLQVSGELFFEAC